MNTENRMTPALVLEILDTLERHGYHRRDHQHTGQAVEMIYNLGDVYEGVRDVPYGTYFGRDPSVARPEPRPSRARTDPNDVTLTVTEAITVSGALGVAADYNRDRLTNCIDCADQTCGSCQHRLNAARTYERLEEQLLQSANTASGAAHSQQPAAQKEAGQ